MMIDQESVQEILGQLGYTPNEVRVYLAMLESGNTVPGAIARYSQLPRQKIYGILRTLADKGGCALIPGDRRTYTPTDPDILLDQAEERLKSLSNKACALRESLTEIKENSVRGLTGEDNIKLVNNPVEVAEMLIGLVSKVREEYLMFSVASRLGPELEKLGKSRLDEFNMRFSEAMGKALEEKRIRFRSLVSLEDPNPALIRTKLGAPQELKNFEVRAVSKVPCRLNIFDRNEVMVSLRDPTTSEYIVKTLYIRDKGIAELLASAFDTRFSNAYELSEIDLENIIG